MISTKKRREKNTQSKFKNEQRSNSRDIQKREISTGLKNESSTPTNSGVDDHCVVCGPDWKNRKPTSYKDLGSKSTPMIYGMQLFKDRLGNRIKLFFCDLHGNNHMNFTKFVKGILQIKNTKTGKWRKATSVGVAT